MRSSVCMMLLRLEQSHMPKSRSDSDTPPHSYHHHNQACEMYERKACVKSSTRGVARSLDCVEIILVGLVSSSLVLTHDLSARCLGSFLSLSLFVLTNIGDRHVFYLLLVCFCMFSVQTQPHYCVLETI